MRTHRPGVGVGGHKRPLGNVQHLPEARIVQVGHIQQNVPLLQLRNHRPAEVRQTVVGGVAGADLPQWLDSPDKAAGLYQRFLDWGLTKEQADGILWKNALRFFQENL